ncbi:methylenetetrahydrofolate reductase [Actinomarinicola tropica]|uniref:Methylenetetrahydrofolate reductase n=1 Tax=Actinomarinicola tropica TaxID=2789776 RepID=A0A5Q2RQJ4_9ACTN|nr:methylenetetrahydrofolate reductase [Actinomarinicola tropica]QGG96831.1 methylenetetrahydrofolate reductase [Actinomarinicola tropica]
MPDARPFEVICEIEPATRPDLTRVRHQIGVLSGVADGFLVPDNHIGRATVSSIAVAHEVERMGGRAIACVNARDRNLLGFRRDLLTAAAYDVADFLFVYGDDPTTGRRTGQLTVRSMIEEVRTFSDSLPGPGPAMRAAVTTGLRPLPSWKAAADALYVQVTWSLDELARWRETVDFDGPVYAGVMVLASASMARKLGADVPQLAAPDDWVEAVERDPAAGVELACRHLLDIRDHGGFAGVHLVPVSRYRETAAHLEPLLGRRPRR